MSLIISAAAQNAIASGMSAQEAFANGTLEIYSGAQPTNADTAPNGTLLVTFTLDGATFTAPIQCIADVALVGTGGTLDDIAIGGLSATTGFDLLGPAIANPGTAAGLVALAVTQINARSNPFRIVASASGDNILLSAPKMRGDEFNSLEVFAAATTTTVNVNASGAGATSSEGLGLGTPSQAGVAAANGLNFLKAVAGVMNKESTTWKGDAGNTGTAAWFRFIAGGHTSAGASTDDIRMDGTTATSGGDMTLTSTAIASGATQTINTFTLTVPST
jgi:hypothetical protein